ncbi:MAG: ribose-5-phosphate isomerase RpiA [Hyphomicrobiaceae bacterium]
MNPDEMKRRAAEAAIELVEPGMRLGLGTGSTARHFVDLLGARVASGLDVLCVPTSNATRIQAESLHIPLTTLDETPDLDLTVDGADELTDDLQLIKGGGGALLREKIVALASDRMVVIADLSKRVARLGAFPLPVEIVRFGWRSTEEWVRSCVEEAGCSGAVRMRLTSEGAPYITDNGNHILDCALGRIEDAELLQDLLKSVPGVVETGLFLDVADTAFVADGNGVVTLRAPAGA